MDLIKMNDSGKLRIFALASILLAVLLTEVSNVEAYKNKTRMFYYCPPEFIRLGSSCYFFSQEATTWQKAFFACKERSSNLTVPARWEDRNLRNHLNDPSIERAARWIGGIYDYGSRGFKWGGDLKDMKFKSSLILRKMDPEKLRWHCIAMLPEASYMWGARSCLERHDYICQTKIRKVSQKERNHLRKIGLSSSANEITAPSLEVPDPTKPTNFKTYDLRPSELKKRANGATRERRLKKLFKGFVWVRNDPDAEYRQNLEVLKSGTTGLSQEQIKRMMRRLKRRRDRQIRRQMVKIKGDDDWLTHPESKPNRELHNAKHLTYTIDNHISDLHPKTIVEVHDFDDLHSNNVA